MAHHSVNDYMAHGFCFLWEPLLVWLHVISDILIGIAYFSIPVALFYFVYKRRDLPFLKIFILFGVVFFLCGTTHTLAAYTVYVPKYWFEGIVKAVTAVVSVVTAFLFIPLLPKAIALPSLTKALEEIKTLNTTLEKQIEELRIKDSAIASTANAISFADLSGHLTYVNNSFLELWGYKSNEEVLGMPVLAFLELDEHAANFIETVRKSGSWAGEVAAKRRNGKLFPVELTWSMILSDSGNPISLIGLFTDITERRKSEEEIMNLAKFPEEDPSPVLRISHDGVLTYANPASLSLLKLWNLRVGHAVSADISNIVTSVLISGSTKDLEVMCGEKIYSLIFAPIKNAAHYVNVYGLDITERKKGENELKLFRNLLNQANDSIFVIDPETASLLDVNDKACSSLGYSQRELLKMNIFDIQPDIPDSFSWKAHVNEVKNKGHVVLEGRHKRKDDRTFPIEVNVNYVSLEKRDYMVAVVRDITERKKAEEALRRSEKKYKDLFDSTLDGIYQVDADGDFILMNPAGARIFGYESPEEIIGKNALEHWRDPKDRDVFRAELKVKKTVSTYHMKAKKKTGEPIELESSSRIREDEKGNFHGIEGILRDVTERKRAEKALRRSEEQLKEAQHLAHIGSWELDIVTNRLFWSDEIYRIFEIDKNDFGASYEAFLAAVHPDDREAVDKAYKISVRDKIPYEIVHRLKLPDGRVKFVQERCETSYHGGGDPLRSIGTVQDITERKLIEGRMQRQLQRFAALRAIDLAISSSLDIHMTLKIFIEQVLTQLGVDAANVLLLNPRTTTLEYAASYGFRTSALRHSHVRLGEGYAGVAALESRIVKIPNLKEEDNGFTRSLLLKGEDFITYYGVPLVAKGHVKGVLEIFHRSPLEPDEEWFEFLDALALQAAIAIDNNALFYELERSNMNLILAYDSTIEGWSRALDYRDKETEGHSQRVTEMTINIARELGINEEEIVHVRRGALLHDIGKMGIPDSILLKPGSLNEEEWKIMRQHPVYSFELLSKIVYLRPALDIPYCHHEKWDGSGYPRGLKGEQIPLSARIFAVVDVWDALRSHRPYRAAWSDEQAKEHILSLSGVQFDPKVVEAFIRVITEKKD